MSGLLLSTDQVSGLPAALASAVTDGQALKGDRQVVVSPSIVSGVLTLDLSLGSVFNVSWNANITSVAVTNCPTGAVSWAVILTGAGGTTVSWPAGVFRFPGGVAPTLTSTAGAQNWLSMATLNGGARTNVFFSGATL